MNAHQEENPAPQAAEQGQPDPEVAGSTIDTGVDGAGDEHFGLEGTRDVRPPSGREDLRLP